MIYRIEVIGEAKRLARPTPSGSAVVISCVAQLRIRRAGHPIPGPFHPLVHR